VQKNGSMADTQNASEEVGPEITEELWKGPGKRATGTDHYRCWKKVAVCGQRKRGDQFNGKGNGRSTQGGKGLAGAGYERGERGSPPS